MGYVDNMGRFVTEIEPDPYRKNDKEWRLSRAVKKLVHIEQDEVSLLNSSNTERMIKKDYDCKNH